MACGGDCDCGPCSKARGVSVSGWASRRKRLSVQSKPAGRARRSSSASTWARSRGALVGGAAARDSVPVSTGGHYRPSRRGARVGQVAEPLPPAELGAQIDHLFFIVQRAIADNASAEIIGDEWRAAFLEALGRWTAERDALIAAEAPELEAWGRMIATAAQELIDAFDRAPGAAPSPMLSPARFATLKPRASKPAATPAPAPSSRAPRGAVQVGPAMPRGGRATGATVIRPTKLRGTVTVPSWLSWVPRIGQATDSVYLEAARQLDTDFNALAVAVWGEARGLMRPEDGDHLTATGRALGEPWRSALRATIERWRSDRDELRETGLIFGTVWGPRIDAYRADVERFAADVRRVSPETPLPTPPRTPEPGALEGAARSLGRGLSSGLRTGAETLALALALGIGLWVASQARARA